MKKYLLRYLFFWFPAAAVAIFYNNPGSLSQVLQWFTAFLMVFGWTVNTGMAAYHHPRGAVSALLAYTGLHVLLIVCMYMTHYDTGLHIVSRWAGGLLSFKALDIFVQFLYLAGGRPWELIVLLLLAGCCLIGLLVGLMQRRIRPDPYRPRIKNEN